MGLTCAGDLIDSSWRLNLYLQLHLGQIALLIGLLGIRHSFCSKAERMLPEKEEHQLQIAKE